jgi:hypothetical protein
VRALGLLWLALSLAVRAHGVDARHDLPAPLAHFLFGAALAVTLSFVVAWRFARRAPGKGPIQAPPPARPLPAPLRFGLRGLGLLLFFTTLAAALVGTADPTMNLAPTFIWIVWWLGLALVAACVVNLWPLLDPWAGLFDAADALARQLGRPQGLALGWHWPASLGVWPAVALLLLWSWLEVIFPLAAVPWRIGCAALAWSAVTWLGMAAFGRVHWQRHGDVFAIYFALLGRMAPLGLSDDGRHWLARRPGSALIADDAAQLPRGTVAFVLAMLATVLFDGLHASQLWLTLEALLARGVAAGLGAGLQGALGLLAVWLLFVAAYALASRLGAGAQAGATAAEVARRFVLTLVPVAVAYSVAHNFSSLVEQGQNVVALVSDPLGRQWNLLGTAGWHIRSELVDARLTWQVAIGMVVLGHAGGIWLAHRVALRDSTSAAQAVRSSLAMVLLMLLLTVASLYVIVEPMVSFTPGH